MTFHTAVQAGIGYARSHYFCELQTLMNKLFQAITFVAVGMASTGSSLANTGTRQIAVNASSAFFSVYRDAGMTGAIVRIQNCYNGAKTRDAYVFCLAMDTQAQRLEHSSSKRMNTPVHPYFTEESFDTRLQVLERWYPSKSQLDYAKNQMMDGLEAGIKAEVARIEKK